MPPLAAKYYDQAPFSEQEQDHYEQERGLITDLYSRMKRAVDLMPTDDAAHSLSLKGVYLAEGQKENERTRAWVEEFKSKEDLEYYLRLDTVTRSENGAVKRVPGSEVEVMILGYQNLKICGTTDLGVEERVEFLLDASDTMDKIEEAMEYKAWQNTFEPGDE